MIRMHRESMMVYGSMQVEFIGTKHNDHTRWYDTTILVT